MSLLTDNMSAKKITEMDQIKQVNVKCYGISNKLM